MYTGIPRIDDLTYRAGMFALRVFNKTLILAAVALLAALIVGSVL